MEGLVQTSALEMKMERYTVRTGVKCRVCSKDFWSAYNGYLRCVCGQRLWIRRYRDDTGLRFRFGQGQKLPAEYRGWSVETAQIAPVTL
jgi:hypothetical protein